METLSSNTLFHFTGKANYLVSILLEGFKPRYCLEDFKMFEFVLGKDSTDWAVPMVCFCDIPLSKVKDHVGKYGNFGIGLTKEWGISNGVSPLIYVNDKSATTLGLSGAMSGLIAQQNALGSLAQEMLSFEVLHKHLEAVATDKALDVSTLPPEQAIQYARFLKTQSMGQALNDAYLSQLRVVRFTKPYFADAWRKWTNVRFYDEREWRFVPDILPQKQGVPPWISQKDYDDEVSREFLNQRIGQQFPLRFKPEDIKYIIVEEESQVPAVIRQIAPAAQFTDDAIKTMLKSKILTKQQIFDDF
jgi:hypothetical protein